MTAKHMSVSDTKRIGLQSNIWGTNIIFRGVSVFLTVNFSDNHNPVFQVFAGEDIDMDHFHHLAGPDHSQHVRNIAADAYAAAKGFWYLTHTMVHDLFGVSTSNK